MPCNQVKPGRHTIGSEAVGIRVAEARQHVGGLTIGTHTSCGRPMHDTPTICRQKVKGDRYLEQINTATATHQKCIHGGGKETEVETQEERVRSERGKAK